MDKAKQAILKTLAYADIFNYPLTAKEIHHWLISSTPIKLINLNFKNIPKIANYFHLPSRQSTVKLRRHHAKSSLKKLKIAQRIANYLKFIPTIKLIAITGALSMNNSNEHDDIDLLIITKTNQLWTTRLISILFLELIGKRRRPGSELSASAASLEVSSEPSSSSKNKICLNLFLDESSLVLPKTKRNLYTAHEVVQIKPIFDRGNTYQDFLNANSWVKQFLPNALTTTLTRTVPVTVKNFLEPLAYKLQLKIMKKKRTREKISPHSAFFHPRPTNKIVLNQYHQKLKGLKLK